VSDENLTPNEIRNVSFPREVRGYNRSAVDAYVRRVNRVIAELEISSSPRAAVRHALEQVGEQTSTILQRARETAEEITASARQEAEENTARAKAEAAEIVLNASTESDRVLTEATADGERAKTEAEELLAKANAEAEGIRTGASAEADEIISSAKAERERTLARTRDEVAALQEEAEARLRDLHADIATTWKERRELLDDVRGIAARLEEEARHAAARVPPGAAAEEPEEKPAEPQATAEMELSDVAPTEVPRGLDRTPPT
jgi:DivIVA domain-containing protein